PAIIPDEQVGIAAAVTDARNKGVRSALLVTGRSASPVEQTRIAVYKSELQRQDIRLVAELRGDYSYQSGRHVASS
ncbi:hypothetical protein, partial [Klebsiella pneumoniae]